MSTQATGPGRRLRDARIARGKTQAAVAAALGVTVQTYGDYERNRRNPSLRWLKAAAIAIGCDPHELDPDLASTGRVP